jgi:hypothetical protein
MAALRLSNKAVNQAVLIEAITPRSLNAVTPKSVRGVASVSAFHIDLDHMTPKSALGGRTPGGRTPTVSSSSFTPKTGSSAAASRLLSSFTAPPLEHPFAACGREAAANLDIAALTYVTNPAEVDATVLPPYSVASKADGTEACTVPTFLGGCHEAYPRLLGRPPAEPEEIVPPSKRTVRFDDDPEELAQGARAAFLAMQRRIASRKLPKRTE